MAQEKTAVDLGTERRMSNETVYLVDKHWMNVWKRSGENRDTSNVPPLFPPEVTDKRGLQRDRHYVVVDETSYSLLTLMYGVSKLLLPVSCFVEEDGLVCPYDTVLVTYYVLPSHDAQTMEVPQSISVDTLLARICPGRKCRALSVVDNSVVVKMPTDGLLNIMVDPIDTLEGEKETDKQSNPTRVNVPKLKLHPKSKTLRVKMKSPRARIDEEQASFPGLTSYTETRSPRDTVLLPSPRKGKKLSKSRTMMAKIRSPRGRVDESLFQKDTDTSGGEDMGKSAVPTIRKKKRGRKGKKSATMLSKLKSPRGRAQQVFQDDRQSVSGFDSGAEEDSQLTVAPKPTGDRVSVADSALEPEDLSESHAEEDSTLSVYVAPSEEVTPSALPPSVPRKPTALRSSDVIGRVAEKQPEYVAAEQEEVQENDKEEDKDSTLDSTLDSTSSEAAPKDGPSGGPPVIPKKPKALRSTRVLEVAVIEKLPPPEHHEVEVAVAVIDSPDSKQNESDDNDDGFAITQYCIPYADLKGQSHLYIDKLDVKKLESYLSDEEFEQVFKMSKQKFYSIPVWKQKRLRIQNGLF